MSFPIIIVGAGQAGAQAVQTLRQGGYQGALTLVGAEPHLPYQRPPLSKKFLSGETDEERLLLRPASLYQELGVELHIGVAATQLDSEHHRVRLENGAVLNYDKLLLATGMRARPLSIPGIDLPGVVTLRSMLDAARLRRDLKPGNRVVIIGGGYIGLEVAAITRGLGMHVTVLEAAERVLGRVVAPDVSRYFAHLHRQHGVELRIGANVIAVEGDTRAEAVVLADGTRVPADFILLSIGAIPETTLAEVAEIEVRDGIIVDVEGKTSARDVFAAGDCARFHSERFGRSIRLESVQNAIDQAKTAALAMLGQTVHYDPVPWFWSDQYDTKLQIVGLSQGYDDIDIDGDPGSGAFSVAYIGNGKLLAVDSINHARRHMQARRQVGETWAGWLN